ncbi:hypothetical protein GCK32_017974, partial [Trichostrongylus colubriformis]
VDPCADLYHYTCGKYIQTPGDQFSFDEGIERALHREITELLESKTPSESKAITASRLFYQKCATAENESRFNRSGGQFLLQKIHAYGYFPLIHSDQFDEDSVDVTSLLTYFNQNRTVLKAILPTVEVDPHNSSRFLITMKGGFVQNLGYLPQRWIAT